MCGKDLDSKDMEKWGVQWTIPAKTITWQSTWAENSRDEIQRIVRTHPKTENWAADLGKRRVRAGFAQMSNILPQLRFPY